MPVRDIYDDIPDGVAQRSHNQRRLAELEQEGEARRVRIATIISQAELSRRAIPPGCDYRL